MDDLHRKNEEQLHIPADADFTVEDIIREFGSEAEETPVVEETPIVEETPAEEKKPAAPVMDEAAIEALIAKQREAIEAQLREKLMAELMASQAKAEEKTEEAAQV